MLTDTIAAISTPLGEGGVSTIRISGENAIKIAKKVFKSQNNKDLEKLFRLEKRKKNSK